MRIFGVPAGKRWQSPRGGNWTEFNEGLISKDRVGHGGQARESEELWGSLPRGFFLGGASGKESACQCEQLEMPVRSLGWEDPLEEIFWQLKNTSNSSILAWRILWTEEPGGRQSIGSQRIGRNWSDLALTQRNKGREYFSEPGESYRRRVPRDGGTLWDVGPCREMLVVTALLLLSVSPWAKPSWNPEGKWT